MTNCPCIFSCRLAETPECWSLDFQLDATFADNFGHISRQLMYICRQFFIIWPEFYEKWNLAGWYSITQHSGISACLLSCRLNKVKAYEKGDFKLCKMNIADFCNFSQISLIKIYFQTMSLMKLALLWERVILKDLTTFGRYAKV